MPTPKLTKQQAKEAVDLINKHGSIAAASMASGLSRHAIKNRLDHAESKWGLAPDPKLRRTGRAEQRGTGDASPSREWEEGSEGASLEIRTRDRISTKEEALAYAELDETKWRTKRVKIKSYEGFYKDEHGHGHIVPMWAISIIVEPVHPFDYEAQRSAFIEDMAKHAPKYRAPARVRRRIKTDYMLEVSIPDIHVGKLAWQDETGEHYDLDVVRTVYGDAVDKLVSNTLGAYPIGHILFPIGNDLLHVDTPSNTTTRGTPQDVAARHFNAYTEARKLVIEQIDKLREIAPVTVLVVPGNHDATRTLFLGDAIQCWYRNDKYVEVRNEPMRRKYVRHGNVLLGFAHGDDEKHGDFESLMIRENPQDFAACDWHEWHLGHYHKRKITKHTAGDTHGGTVVRIIPSLSATDKWHYDKGYVKGPKGAEGFVWSKAGFEALFNYTPPVGLYERQGATP